MEENADKKTRVSKHDLLKDQFESFVKNFEELKDTVNVLQDDISSLRTALLDVKKSVEELKSTPKKQLNETPEVYRNPGTLVSEAVGLNEVRESFIIGGPPVDAKGNTLVVNEQVKQPKTRHIP